MINTPTDDELKRLPPLYTNENVKSDDVMIQQHYFILSSDWFMSEYSPEEKIFYGYAILNEDLINSEFGYVSFDELKELKAKIPAIMNGETCYFPLEVERETGFKPKKFVDVFEEYKKKHGLDD